MGEAAEAGEFAAGQVHKVHMDDIDAFIHGLLERGQRDIVIAIDAEKFYNNAMTDVMIIRLSDHYDRTPLEIPAV